MGQDFWDAQRWQREFETKQIIHTEACIGMSKVESTVAACYLYDVVVDATDNRPSHYMINDCCVFLGRLTVYNYNGGLCYRCLFPTPLPTVKHTLSKGNPHLVYGARVLVKPYREKSKL
ncbi:adenylyltransferase and sulfurtransferase MOCS3 isoform X2 [Capsicum annuum]